MKITPGHIEGEHVFFTGPVRGTVELEDGTVVDVTPDAIEVAHLAPEQVQEVDFLIGEYLVQHGHPDDVELDEDPDSETFGQMVQRPFEHVHPERFNDHPKKFRGKAAGVPRKQKKG